MHRLLTIMAFAASASAFCCCSSAPSLPTTREEIDARAEALKLEILDSKSQYSVSRDVYYVSADGSDSNSGLSESCAIQTLDKVNSLPLRRGDVVLFRRGDMWRGCVRTQPGVTYSAYGKGPKPFINGSPFDAARTGDWKLTDASDVYVFSEPLKLDVGVMVFDGGAATGFKVMKRSNDDGSTVHVDTGEPFETYADLHRDLDFWHESRTGLLYLCSKQGNPSERFHSIELPSRHHGFYAVDDVTIDNICIKYVGTHGIGSLTTTGLTVTNCEIGWIGGCIQRQDPGHKSPTRYGNGVEIFGGCGKYTIDHCWVYQCYDAGISHQYSRGGNDAARLRNVTYTNNLIEDCVYDIEYFVGLSTNNSDRLMENVRISDNILRRAGYGFGCQRPNKNSPALIKSWNHWNKSVGFEISGNVLDLGKPHFIHVAAVDAAWLPRFDGNVYVAQKGTDMIIGAPGTTYPVDDSFPERIETVFGEKNGTFILVDPQEEIESLIRGFLEENGATGYESCGTEIVDTVLSQLGKTALYGVRHLYSLTNESGARVDTTKAWFAITPDLDGVLYMTGIDWDYNDWKTRYQLAR